jgi:protein-L-isoaspartate(D-aspartate) O-methyltransferase
MKRPSLRGVGMTSDRTRERMVQRIREHGVVDERVLEAMRNVPRHVFVDEALASRAYDDDALPIGFGQTISQPLTVARMTQALLQDGPVTKILEVGSGCGYQAAILAALVEQVYSVERIGALIRLARGHFMALGIRNVRLRHGDGYQGWEDYAPFDAIIVTAAAPEVPVKLLEQLALGGRLLIPLGTAGKQKLCLVRRTASGYTQDLSDDVNFVPLRTGHR